VLAAVSLLLRPYFKQVITLQSPVRLEEVLRDGVPDCLLLDMNFSAGINTGNEGIYWLNRVKRLYPDLPVVLFTAYGDIDLAVRGMKEGAVDFIIKPWDNARLVDTLLKASAGSREMRLPMTTTPCIGARATPCLRLSRLLSESLLPMQMCLLRERTVLAKRCLHVRCIVARRVTRVPCSASTWGR